ncbi:MAG: hypothetical protein JW846_01085 [Dehalococcoidia bacterium]|nr:hypothetical protein [Dehalococcoidia bacterium]
MDQSDEQQIVAELRDSVATGHDWYRAMLSAIRVWPSAEEDFDGARCVYLIDGEALDLMRLCERLSVEIGDLVPEEQIVDLLTRDHPPTEVSREELKSLLGPDKYKAYLSYLYGVLVEEMVPLAVLEELRKARRASGLTRADVDIDDAYEYVYGSGKQELAVAFQRERGLPRRHSMTLTELKEFTYWLFKLRLKASDKARVASDTKRALTVLHRYTAARASLSL